MAIEDVALPGISAIGGLVGQHMANAANARMAREQMRFQERMSNTAMQRHRTDLERAGYNPMLGVGGTGASTPVGATSRSESAVGAGINSGLQARQVGAQLRLIAAQSERELAQANLARQQSAEIATMLPSRAAHTQAQADLATMDTRTRAQLVSLVAAHMSSETARNLASALDARSHAALADAERILKEFQQNEARNLSEVQKSWWMRNVSPYLNDAKSVVVGAAGATAVGRVGSKMVAEQRAISAASKRVAPILGGRK